jgi:DNA-binding NarL/FixJ family response regulator
VTNNQATDSRTKTRNKLTLLIVDDHPMVREGLAGIFARYGIGIAGLATNGQQAIELFQSTRPDIVLLDLRLPDQSGIEVLRTLRRLDPAARVVMLTSAQGEASIYEAIQAGASGYLLKGVEGAALAEHLHHVAAGGKALSAETAEKLARFVGTRKLSEREIEVLTLISQGKSNKEVAQMLFVTEDTVKMHVKNILQKLQAQDRTQAVVIAIQRGLLAY